MEPGREKIQLKEITGGKFHRSSIQLHVQNGDSNYVHVVRKVNLSTLNRVFHQNYGTTVKDRYYDKDKN